MSRLLLSYEALAQKPIDTQLSSLPGERLTDIEREFIKVVRQDFDKAIGKIPEFLAKGKHPNAQIESLAGPNTAQIWDELGFLYPHLDRNTRKEVLQSALNYLDGKRYDYSQEDVETINDPWLASDIVITRPLYWPGFNQYSEVLKKHRSWGELHGKHLLHIKSAFWFAMAVAQKDHASEEVRQEFYAHFPTLMDRTQDAIAGITANHAESESLIEGKTVEECIVTRLEKYDPVLHPTIRKKMVEKKWIALCDETQFVYQVSRILDTKPQDKNAFIAFFRFIKKSFEGGHVLLNRYKKYWSNDMVESAIQEVLAS